MLIQDVCFQEGINFDVQFVGQGAGDIMKNSLFGGEGLFITMLSGKGKVIIQSKNLIRLSRTLHGATGPSPENRSSGNIFKMSGDLTAEMRGREH